MPNEPHEKLTQTEARGGDGRKMNRVVLVVSLVILIAAFLAIFLIYA